ncbi:MAG: ATP-binding domain-containing protein [Pseudomonadota bacterium]
MNECDEARRALTAQERQILDQELSSLARVQASLASARAAQAHAAAQARLRPDAVEVVRALRSEAASASEDDLPALLHELSVRQTLLARRPKDALPNPDSPYIAHLRLREGGLATDYFLGQNSHLDAAHGVRVVDWRVAPVARIFYGYREGDEYEEEFPGRVAEGTLEARRIVVIEGGELHQLVTDGVVLTRADSGQWHSQTRASYAIASGGAGSAVRAEALAPSPSQPSPSVTALLDAQQFAAISAPPEQPLLVLGSAGSGKTTVALHRLARIATLGPERYALDRMQVVVPEEGLARLSRRLLAPLGMAEARVQTLDDWAWTLAQRLFGARLPRLCPDTPALVSSLKRHPALYSALRARFARPKAASDRPSLKRLRRLVAELFSDREFLSGVVDSAQGTLSRAAVDATVRHTMLQLADNPRKQQAAVVDRSRLRTLDGRAIADATPEALAQTLDIEDLPIFLAILAWRNQLEPLAAGHLVLDEAEDFSLFELHVLGQLQGPQKSITLAGDEAQQTSSSFAGFEASLAEFGARDAEVCRLSVSYRCPRPIFELAQQILGDLASGPPKSAARDGAAVGHFAFPSAELATLFCVGELVDLAQREPAASIAVVAHDADAAQRFHALLPERAQARLVLSGEFTFEPGIDVTDLDNVKGLEFDYVLLPQVSDSVYPLNDRARRRLHVAVTRAVWQLWLVSGGNRSKILPALGA